MSACEKALDYSKKIKIDECESVSSKRHVLTVRITDSEIVEVKQNIEQKLGIRIINQKKIAGAQTSIIKDIPRMFEQAQIASSHMRPKDFWKSLPANSSYSKIDRIFDAKLTEVEGSKAADIAQEMINSSQNPKISSISGSLNIVSEDFEIENSNGLYCSSPATYISGLINAESTEGIVAVSGIGQQSCRTLDCFSPEKIGQDAAQMCIDSTNPQNCELGTYSIIFEPYSVGELLAFVFSSNFSLKVFSEKKSCFSENLDQKVADENFTLVDDPHAPEGIGSKPFDDEGVATKPSNLIEKGVFKNTFSDSFNAFKEDKETSANASRPGSPMGRDAEPIPIPSPHNLRITNGNQSQEDMIKDTKHGLLVGRLWYTYAVNPIKGDFSCTARSGIKIIENGEIKNPGRSVRIIQNLPKLLQNISAIGNDSRNVLQWASLPSITPSLKVDRVKVIPIK